MCSEAMVEGPSCNRGQSEPGEVAELHLRFLRLVIPAMQPPALLFVDQDLVHSTTVSSAHVSQTC